MSIRSHRGGYSIASDSENENSENVYCILLHVVEGIGLSLKDGVGDFCDRHKDKIILNASLNGVKFEIEGHSAETTTIFNSNCIWECELSDIKRMKTDNRPVKLECYIKSGRAENSPRKTIGSLLLPIRGVQTFATLKDNHFKLHWHKLGALNSDWRDNKPEIYLFLIIVKKTIFESGQLEAMLGKKKFSCQQMGNDTLTPHVSETAMMLQSQSNVYVQLLEQIGCIQVGNNPEIDCDIYHVTLTFKHLRHVAKLVELERNYSRQLSTLVFQYDFLGSVSSIDLNMNASDCYAVNEKISLSFKSSVRSLRTYFERIFYVPINLFWNEVAIANFRFDLSKHMPEDSYFDKHKTWTKQGSFQFGRLFKILSPRAAKPSMDFIVSIQLMHSYSLRKCNESFMPLNETYMAHRNDQRAAGDSFNMDSLQQKVQQWHRSIACYQQNMLNVATALCSQRSNKHASEVQSIKEVIDEVLPPNTNNAAGEQPESDEAQQHQPKDTVDVATQPSPVTATEAPSAAVRDVSTATVSVAVNTDELSEKSVESADDLTYRIVCELEEWKAQQMEHFLSQLERKEAERLEELKEHWQKEGALLQARLDAKTAQCAEYQAKLDHANAELKILTQKLQEQQQSLPPPAVATQAEGANIAETVKRQIESEYAQKFSTLEAQMQRLKTELQHKGTTFDIQQKQVQIENTKLEQEKLQLKTQIELLQKQFDSLEKTHVSADELKSVMADMRTQNDRFAELEKSKEYYKDEWTKTTSELHKLKLNLIKDQKRSFAQQHQNATGGNAIDFCLEDILNEETDALDNDRTELKSIKEMLLLTSDDNLSLADDDLNADP